MYANIPKITTHVLKSVKYDITFIQKTLKIFNNNMLSHKND